MLAYATAVFQVSGSGNNMYLKEAFVSKYPKLWLLLAFVSQIKKLILQKKIKNQTEWKVYIFGKEIYIHTLDYYIN